MNRIMFPQVRKLFITAGFLLILFSVTAVSEKSIDQMYPASYYKLILDLSEDERQWIADHKTIRVSGPRSFPPFYSYSADGTSLGIASDYIKIIFDNLGIEIETVPDLPWPDVLDRTKRKELDLIACSAKSPDREEFLLFTEAHLSFPMVIISRDDSPFIGGLEDLSGQKVAVVTKNIVSDWLKRDNIKIIPVQSETPLAALEAVSVGSAEAYIGNLASCSYQIHERGLSNLKIAAPTEYKNYSLFIAVRNDWPELVSILNKALNAMAPKQHSEIRNQWLSIRYEHGVRAWDVIRIILIISLFATLIIALILLWNRRLAREIDIRKKTEEDLKEALENIKSLSGLLPICAHCKNIRDDKGYWNQIEEYLEVHTRASFSHSLCPKCYEELYGKEDWYDKNKTNTKESDQK